METYTKTELLEAQGPFYQADPSWRKKFEEWTGTGVLKPEESEARIGRTAPHRYSVDTAYILAVLFHLRAVGFANTRIKDVSRCLYTGLEKHPDPGPGPHPYPIFGEYWNAAKIGGEPEWYRFMIYDYTGQKLSEPRSESAPCELIIYLVPDDGQGFDENELSAFVTFGAAPASSFVTLNPTKQQAEHLHRRAANQGRGKKLPHFPINLSELFAAVKLPVRRPPIEAPVVPVGRATLPPFQRHLVPVATELKTVSRKRKRSAKAAVA